MARTKAELTKGARITDYISLGVIGKVFPMEKVKKVLDQTGKTSQRQRDLPAPVVVYYVIALALYMQVSYREVLRSAGRIAVVGRSRDDAAGGRQIGHLPSAYAAGGSPHHGASR